MINQQVQIWTKSKARIEELEQNLIDKSKKFEEKQNENKDHPISCDACELVGKNKTGLMKHIKSKHKNRKTLSIL